MRSSRDMGSARGQGRPRRPVPGRGKEGARAPDAPVATRASSAGWLLPALALALALLVHRRALTAFFGTDDFVRLEEAAGLLPQARTLWRLVSEVLYIKGMLVLFGPRPLPFHLVSMALHLVNTALVHRTARRAGLPPAAAFFAATFFGGFHVFYMVLPSAVNINDVLALTFVFLALLAFETPTLLRSAAGVGCFVVALLSKEAVVFVPGAAVWLPQSGTRPGGAARRLAPLLVTGAAFAALYLAFRKQGLGTGGPAYAVGFGINLFHNLMTYARWSIDVIRFPGGGTPDPAAWRVGLLPLAAFALAAAASPARRAVILAGAAWWLLGLVPVLPLLAHSYGHYLYVPMAGFALALAATLDALASGIARLAARRGVAVRGWRGSPTAAVLVLLAIAAAARSEFLVRGRVIPRLGTSELALDPFTRKMEIAERSVTSVAGQIDRAHDSLVVFTPPGFGRTISSSTGKAVEAGPPGAPQYDVVGAVLDGGRALRLFEPALDSVAFVSRWTPAYRNFTMYIEGPAGQLAKIGRTPETHAKFAGDLLDAGYAVQARDYLAGLVEAYPRDRMMRLLLATALAQTGDPDHARTQARLVAEVAPQDSVATLARLLLQRLGAAK